METSEELREILLDLEEARRKEALQRQMAEALLAGLRVLATSNDAHTMFTRLFDVMKEPLWFEAAFVLLENDSGLFVPMTTSDPVFKNTVWQPGAMFGRVLQGQPVAVFDTQLIQEWKVQPEEARCIANSALHFSINAAGQRSIMVCTHSERAHFSKEHVALARRFSVLAAQALQKLESAEKLADLQKRLEVETMMTELNRKLAESEQKLAMARKMEAVGLLAGGVAHDLNNIFTSLVGYPDLLLMDDKLRPEQRRAIQTIRDAGLRAAAVVDDLLTVARGAASSKEPLNLNKIVEGYLLSAEYQRLLNLHSGVKVETDLNKYLFNIEGSRIHVTKSLVNLVYNAVEAAHHIPDGMVLIGTENRYIEKPFGAYKDIKAGEYAVLFIKDNGDGISPEDIDRIFEPFYTKKKMGRSGTGLGLTIVWNVMEDHQGYVEVLSGKAGTEFRLYFPAKRDTMPDAKTVVTIDDFRGRGESVLVIDDLEEQRKIAGAILTELGYNVHLVASGELALEYLQDHSVDILVLDMIMDPGMNGFETYKKIIEIHPGQKAVIASGYSMNQDVVAVQRLGAGAFLKKPYTLSRLGQAIKAELNK